MQFSYLTYLLITFEPKNLRKLIWTGSFRLDFSYIKTHLNRQKTLQRRFLTAEIRPPVLQSFSDKCVEPSIKTIKTQLENFFLLAFWWKGGVKANWNTGNVLPLKLNLWLKYNEFRCGCIVNISDNMLINFPIFPRFPYHISRLDNLTMWNHNFHMVSVSAPGIQWSFEKYAWCNIFTTYTEY